MLVRNAKQEGRGKMERKASDNTPRAWAHPAETPGRGREFHGYSREELGHTATPRGNESSPTYLAPPGRWL